MLDVFFSPLQYFLQVIQIVVGEDTNFCAAEPGGVHNAGVNKLVEDDDVIFAQQGADGSGGGGIAGGETQRGFGAFEIGEGFFKFVVRCERTANQPGRAGTSAESFNGLDCRFLQNRIVGETKIIVR